MLAVTLGYAVSYLRTSLGEAALYQAAVTENTVASLEAYLARGGTRPEVRRRVLAARSVTLAKAKVRFRRSKSSSARTQARARR